jgi:glycosyltransferase involved in cell wall biosynthesis
MKPAFTFIIGYRHRQDRIVNLRRTLEWLYSFNNCEIILVEQDTHSKIEQFSFRVNHIFTYSDKPYNRSWSFNVGLKHATSDIIVFGDSDIIIEPNNFIESLKEISNYDVVSPYKSVVDLEPNEVYQSFTNIFKISRPGRGENDNQKINLCGGVVIFRRDAAIKIAGWPEEYIGWGAEDNAQTHKVENFLTFKEMPFRCFHLWHQREQPDMQLYQRNLQILNQFVQFDKEKLTKYINSNSSKIGLKNKYS